MHVDKRSFLNVDKRSKVNVLNVDFVLGAAFVALGHLLCGRDSNGAAVAEVHACTNDACMRQKCGVRF